MFRPLDQELLRLKSTGTERRLPYSRSRASGSIELGGRQLVDFASFDYLGLSNQPLVIKAAQQALAQHGISQAPSRVSAGSLPELISAEERLARFFGTEAALFFSSRNQALLSLLSAIVSQGDLVAFDECSHAPIADATFLLETGALSYSGDRPEDIGGVIDRAGIIPLCLYAEGVSPITGEVFPFQPLFKKLSQDKKFHLIVDESYALGALGERGSGSYEASGSLFPSVSFVGSLGLGLPGFGGFVAGRGVIVDFLKQTSRAFESEPPIPCYVAAGVEAAVDSLELELLGRNRLLEVSRRLRDMLQAAGLSVLGGSSPILSVEVRSFKAGREIADRISSKGFLVELVGLRGLRREQARLRVVVSKYHTQQQIDMIAALLIESCGKKL